MYYDYHYCYSKEDQSIRKLLKERGIRYTEGKRFDDDPPLLVFDVASNRKDFEELVQTLRALGAHWIVTIARYTQKEIEEAKLLWLQPKRQSIGITKLQKAFDFSCITESQFGPVAHHAQQTGLLSISKEPSTNTRTAFWAADFGVTLHFTDRRVVELAKENGLIGIEFKPVLRGKKGVSENIFQITTQKELDLSCIGLGYGETKMSCPVCGKEQYSINAAYQVHLDFSKIREESDFYKTVPVFGDGSPQPLHIISQRFYRLLKQHRLDGSIIVDPVADISEQSTDA